MTTKDLTSTADFNAVTLGAGRVLVPHGSGFPARLISELLKSRSVHELVHNRVDAELEYVVNHEADVRHRALMVGRATRAKVHSGAYCFVPNNFGLTPRLIRNGSLDVDAVVVHVPPPDSDGWLSYGTCTSYLPAAVESNKPVIAQINHQMPKTSGERLHLDQVAGYLEVNDPLIDAPPERHDDPIVRGIAEHIQGWVPDRSFVQVGIGVLGNAILKSLGEKKRISLWTETFGDSAVDLMAAGRISTIDSGAAPITATFVTASRRAYAVLGAMPGIEFMAVDKTNDPARIAQLGRPFRTINGAVQIDLSGQVNAESLGGRIFSGSGGQLDFAVGASLHPEGKGIWVLPSQTRKGVSRICATIPAGNAVTVPRSLVGVVATEYGAVDLEGLSLEERARALISIAHPDHRDRLRRDYETLSRDGEMA